MTIGVELVARPALLLFLDEPTSGLDSQTSWNILQLLRKLTEHGQAILCTIHQPSAILFENFDRLLFLAKGGKTVYFGEVGPGSHILIDYFTRNGAPPCPPDDNPAEWMLAAIGAAPGTKTDIDWFKTWQTSPERKAVRAHLEEIKEERPKIVAQEKANAGGMSKLEAKLDKAAYSEFAAPFSVQVVTVLKRVFQQYWRTPSYIWSKFALATASVSHQIPLVALPTADQEPGAVHRVLVLQVRHIPRRSREPIVLRFHGLSFFFLATPLTGPPDVPDLQSTRPADHAKLCHPAKPVRSPRTTIKDILLEGVHPFQHYRRDTLEW